MIFGLITLRRTFLIFKLGFKLLLISIPTGSLKTWPAAAYVIPVSRYGNSLPCSLPSIYGSFSLPHPCLKLDCQVDLEMRYFKVSPAITHFIGWLLQLHCGTLYRRLPADPSSGMQWLSFVLHNSMVPFSATAYLA